MRRAVRAVPIQRGKRTIPLLSDEENGMFAGSSSPVPPMILPYASLTSPFGKRKRYGKKGETRESSRRKRCGKGTNSPKTFGFATNLSYFCGKSRKENVCPAGAYPP